MTPIEAYRQALTELGVADPDAFLLINPPPRQVLRVPVRAGNERNYIDHLKPGLQYIRTTTPAQRAADLAQMRTRILENTWPN